ncbi:MAG: HAD family phosphatase [Anaerolineales bacterium]|nr:HAD family phosphatase [Anaerolineales bacterium]
MTLKAVIFDVGGVLIRTHNRAGREKWATRLGLDPWEFENFVFSGESGRQAQLGKKTSAEHWRWLGEHFQLTEPDLTELRRDFFTGDMLDEALIAHIQRLREAGYRTGLLSNFWDVARRLWVEVYPFIHLFDGVVISSEVGLMKPDPRIYHLAVESVGAIPAEALFIDDFSQNIEGAKAVGIQTVHFINPETARQEIARLTGVE